MMQSISHFHSIGGKVSCYYHTHTHHPHHKENTSRSLITTLSCRPPSTSNIPQMFRSVIFLPRLKAKQPTNPSNHSLPGVHHRFLEPKRPRNNIRILVHVGNHRTNLQNISEPGLAFTRLQGAEDVVEKDGFEAVLCSWSVRCRRGISFFAFSIRQTYQDPPTPRSQYPPPLPPLHPHAQTHE